MIVQIFDSWAELCSDNTEGDEQNNKPSIGNEAINIDILTSGFSHPDS